MIEATNTQQATSITPAGGDGALARRVPGAGDLANLREPIRPADIIKQVELVHEVLRAVMRPGEHYGKIPGCGAKFVLLQPGAQKLAMMFRLRPCYDVQIRDLTAGHREYEVCCSLFHIATGEACGQGWGSCSTAETKYRYRRGPDEILDVPVPAGYWERRKDNPHAAKAMLPEGARVSKIDGQWAVARPRPRVEHPDIADYYNTCLKMGQKRAFVAAVLNATAASDIFAPEDSDDAGMKRPAATATGRPSSAPARTSDSTDASSSGSRTLGETGAERLRNALAGVGRSFEDLLHGLRDFEPEAYPVCTGIEIGDIPAAALAAIGRVLERFAQDHATEPVAAASAADENSEDDIPF